MGMKWRRMREVKLLGGGVILNAVEGKWREGNQKIQRGGKILGALINSGSNGERESSVSKSK